MTLEEWKEEQKRKQRNGGDGEETTPASRSIEKGKVTAGTADMTIEEFKEKMMSNPNLTELGRENIKDYIPSKSDIERFNAQQELIDRSIKPTDNLNTK